MESLQLFLSLAACFPVSERTLHWKQEVYVSWAAADDDDDDEDDDEKLKHNAIKKPSKMSLRFA